MCQAKYFIELAGFQDDGPAFILRSVYVTKTGAQAMRGVSKTTKSKVLAARASGKLVNLHTDKNGTYIGFPAS